MGGTAWARNRAASVLSIVALTLCPLIAGCANGNTPRPIVTTTVEPKVTTEATDTVPQEEIWQWALGRNAWNDPALTNLAASLGRSSKTNILSHGGGFQLDLDDSGTVVAVVLYNDEDSLGLPASETSFRAYAGSLPGQLTWQDSYGTVVAQAGAGQKVAGGWGAEYTFAYLAGDGHRIDVTYLAKHSAELPASPIHTITMRLPAE
jgi:hypothetical protein